MSYYQYQGGASAVVRVARGTRANPKGEKSEQPFITVPLADLPDFRYQEKLAALGFTVAGQVLSVAHLTLDAGIDLAACLSLTRKQQELAPPELGLSEEAERQIMLQVPLLTAPGVEVDLYPKSLKHTLEGRRELIRVNRLILEHYARRGVHPRLSLSASCEAPRCPDPDGPDCPHGASGSHFEFQPAVPELRRPDLLHVMLREAERLGSALGLAWGEGSPKYGGRPGYRGGYIDTSTLKASAGTRGSLLRVPDAPHAEHGPKIVVSREPREGYTPLAPWWLEDAILAQDRAAALERDTERRIRERPVRERAPLLTEDEAREIKGYPNALAVISEQRGNRELEHVLTLALPAILIMFRMSRSQGVALLQGALQRRDRRTVEHAWDSTASKIAAGNTRVAGRDHLIKKHNLYSFLERLAYALAADTGKEYEKVFKAVAKPYARAGASRVQSRTEVVRPELERIYGAKHPYVRMFKRMSSCGVRSEEDCPQWGVLRKTHRTCHVLPCDVCKPYRNLLTRDRAVRLWEDEPGASEDRLISVAESPEFKTMHDLRRWRKKRLPPAGLRWVIGCRGEGRYYLLIAARGRHAHLTANMIPEAVRVRTKLEPWQAADLLISAFMSVHAVAQDLLMADVTRWVAFMDQLGKIGPNEAKGREDYYSAHLTGAQRTGNPLPWPKKDEPAEAVDPDYAQDELPPCPPECKKEHWHVYYEPITNREIGRVPEHPATADWIYRQLVMAGLEKPSQRLVAEADQLLGRKPPARGTPYRRSRL